MKKIFLILFAVCSLSIAYSQDNSLSVEDFEETLPDNLVWGLSSAAAMNMGYSYYSGRDASLLQLRKQLNDTIEQLSRLSFDEEYGLYKIQIWFKMDYSDYQISPVTKTIYENLVSKYSIFPHEEGNPYSHYHLPTMDIVLSFMRHQAEITYKSLNYETFLVEQEEARKQELSAGSENLDLGNF